jgi:branched-subunit amino acid ABC-type transport system permease component
MESPVVRGVSASRGFAISRVLVISALGPLTTFGGFVWALVQPYRITLLHPHGQGFWWLFVEPPLLVMVVGLIFARVVARPLIADLEAYRPGDHDGAP